MLVAICSAICWWRRIAPFVLTIQYWNRSTSNASHDYLLLFLCEHCLTLLPCILNPYQKVYVCCTHTSPFPTTSSLYLSDLTKSIIQHSPIQLCRWHRLKSNIYLENLIVTVHLPTGPSARLKGVHIGDSRPLSPANRRPAHARPTTANCYVKRLCVRTRTRTRTNTHTHTRARSRAHACTHARTHSYMYV